MDNDNPSTIAYLTTFPPRTCGIATFTSDLAAATDNLFMPAVQTIVVAMLTDTDQGIGYDDSKVKFFIKQDNPEDYISAAKMLNSSPEIAMVNIQHEFGLFGNDRGANLLHFLYMIEKPVVTTMHTVLPNPDQQLKNIVAEIASHSRALVVMTELSKQILVSEYAVVSKKISVIPHGIHPTSYSLSAEHKKALGISANEITLETFGLLSRSKGIEYVLQALPKVVAKYPNVKYRIIGATHPEVIKQEGQTYRESLEALVETLGLSQNVVFINKYIELPTLLEYLQATDIYISSSLDPNQAVSGTLSYALGSGRPVISTAFAQAKTLVNDKVGRLVGFRNSEEIADAILEILEDPKQMEAMGENAYFNTRQMTWQNVALAYMRLFSRIAPDLSISNMNLPSIKLDQLKRLTDPHGIFQFAKLNVGDSTFGYTLDDNARALVFSSRYFAHTGDALALQLARTYLDFMESTLTDGQVFLNYFDKEMLADARSEQRDSQEDANARAIRSLMEVSSNIDLPEDIHGRASALILKRCAGKKINFSYPRAIAFYCIGLYYAQKNNPENIAALHDELKRYCDMLVSMYKANASDDWQWFEPVLSYSNSILSEALLLGYEVTDQQNYFDIGKKTLDFLLEQTFINNIYVPIGQNGWYARGGARSYFDQQPEEVSAMVQTLAVIYRLTEDPNYSEYMNKAFYWFLGENILGQFIYDTITGGSYDGIGENSINLNQGAESTISYLLARLTLETYSKKLKKI